jgi:TolA-binding protein
LPAWSVIAITLVVVTSGAVAKAHQKRGRERSPLESLQHSVADDDARQAALLLDRLLQSGTPAERNEAQMLAGRVALMRGDTKAFEAIAAAMRRAPLDENASRLLAAYDAWAVAIKGRPDDARAALDALLGAQSDCPSTADVAEILARVQVMRQDVDGVRQAVAFGRTFCKYHGQTRPYIEPLYRRHLERAAAIGKDPGEPIFQKAEAARTAGKWNAASLLYERVVREYPSSPLRHPSGFWLGECVRREGKVSRAITLWEQFIESEPCGPWRGQAHVGIIDASLEPTCDLAIAEARVSVARAAIEQPRSPEAETSWRLAAGDIHVRHGLFELIQERHKNAGRAFEAAKQCAQASGKAHAGGPAAAEVDRLIVFTDGRQPLVPRDVMPSADKSGTRLALGCGYEVMGRCDRVRDVLAPIAKGRATGGSVEQRSYAMFVLARVGEAEGKSSQAILEYRNSLESGPKKTWHPEALHRMALLLERPAKGSARPESLNEALTAWRTLLRDHPESPRAVPARYHAGSAAAALGNHSEAVELWKEQVALAPGGEYAGLAHVELGRVTLETLLELAAADDHVRAGLAWYGERVPQEPVLGKARVALPSDWPIDPSMKSAEEIGYQLYRHAGLTAYLKGDNERAVAMFRSAAAFESEARGADGADFPSGGMKRLMEAAQGNLELVPKEVLAGGDRGKLLLQLAACSFTAQEFEHVLELTERVIQERSRVSPQQRAWAWFLHGRAHHGAMRPMEALADFRKAASEARNASWGAQCQFYVANSTFTYEKNIPAAIREWQQLVRRYPDSPYAERAAYHVGVAQQVAGQFSEAERSYEAFVNTYPTSPFVRPIQSHHLPRLRERPAGQP